MLIHGEAEIAYINYTVVRSFSNKFLRWLLGQRRRGRNVRRKVMKMMMVMMMMMMNHQVKGNLDLSMTSVVKAISGLNVSPLDSIFHCEVIPPAR